jgi:NADPH-dependent curcumin reductase CurA
VADARSVDGGLRHREHIVEGLGKAPEALVAQLKGGDLRKLLKVGDDAAI